MAIQHGVYVEYKAGTQTGVAPESSECRIFSNYRLKFRISWTTVTEFRVAREYG